MSLSRLSASSWDSFSGVSVNYKQCYQKESKKQEPHCSVGVVVRLVVPNGLDNSEFAYFEVLKNEVVDLICFVSYLQANKFS